MLNAATFSALAEPHRLQIVELLSGQPLTVGEIAARLQLRQPQASKHLRVLSEAGLVAVQPAANRRIYALRAEPFQDLDGWLETYRGLWEGRFDRLEGYVQQLQDAAAPADPPADAPAETPSRQVSPSTERLP
ncbi:ArsR/SmtB family transcription factor [Deinococcus budaensis]|uniref:DNA-binding transcriptional ArsR family regulator n=1 Tax=Deinococcus budaensis TaxID=1665626 RepID=A0A7W8GGU5_9DEIO|nr:metalloregulator ArsR/SmtB family transcription factor [Deinococcus budaensis]MBB5235079.1 DNA-binding transcriptional ArsR family regulator [Deinococcus budaensis]